MFAGKVAAGHDAADASDSTVELDAFLEKEEAATVASTTKKKKVKQLAEDEPKLFMELGWSAQQKIGTTAPVLRQAEGDSLKQRLRAYRRSIFFHIHGALARLDLVW